MEKTFFDCVTSFVSPVTQNLKSSFQTKLPWVKALLTSSLFGLGTPPILLGLPTLLVLLFNLPTVLFATLAQLFNSATFLAQTTVLARNMFCGRPETDLLESTQGQTRKK